MLTEESVSSMDIDLSLDKSSSTQPQQFVQQQQPPALGSQLPSDSSSPKPVGHGMGKPIIGKKFGKKISGGQQGASCGGSRPKGASVVSAAKIIMRPSCQDFIKFVLRVHLSPAESLCQHWEEEQTSVGCQEARSIQQQITEVFPWSKPNPSTLQDEIMRLIPCC